MVSIPEVDDSKSRMNSHSIIGKSRYSLAEECKHICENKDRINGF